MAAFSKLKPGITVYQIKRIGMGNTTVKYNALCTLRILAVNPETERVYASWNSNSPRWYGKADYKSWKVKKPEPKGNRFGTPTY